jgi:hypothetical protein
MRSASQDFEDYANFSVRVDRFYNVVNIYGMHHSALKSAYQAIPEREVTREALQAEQTDERFRRFGTVAVNSLDYMATTGIFSDSPDLVPGQIPDDVSNFGYYTCFCFQWTLFENFVKTSTRRAISAGGLPLDVVRNLRDKEYRTKAYLDYIESGAVFARSPFTTVLPVTGWVPTTEQCTYADLDLIRDLRNSFVHGVGDPGITPDNMLVKYKLYERSMWILRQFASNVDQEVQLLLA